VNVVVLLIQFLLLAAGLALLILGASWLVDGAGYLARRYNVSDLVIGLTVVAIGTSVPELVVSVISSLKGESGLAIGNVIGSNIANLLLVLGAAGAFRAISVNNRTVWREIPVGLATAILFLVMVSTFNDPYLVSRGEGAILLVAFFVYLGAMFWSGSEPPAEVAAPPPARSTLLLSVMVVAGIAATAAGGDLIVRSASRLALGLGVSQELIGVTIVAVGTSLPELATSAVSILKGKSDIAVGNVIGSNIANTCLVLGAAAVICPISGTRSFVIDGAVNVAASLLFFVFVYAGGRHRLGKWQARLFLAGYVAYIAFVVVNR